MSNFWDERFSEEGLAYGENANDFLKDKYNLFKSGGNILCIAEGEGRNAIFLAQKGFHVTSMDQSRIGIEKMIKRAQELNLSLKTHVSDLSDFNFGENHWDGVVSIFGHLPEELRKKVHSKIIKSLKPHGLFLFEAYTPKQLEFGTGGPKDISMLLTEEIIKSELSALKTIHLSNVIRDIFEGKYHTGKSSVIQYIGEKV